MLLSATIQKDGTHAHDQRKRWASPTPSVSSELEDLLGRVPELLQDAGQLTLRLVLGLVAADGVHHGRLACMGSSGV